MRNVKVYFDKATSDFTDEKTYGARFDEGNGEIINKWRADNGYGEKYFMTCKQNDNYYCFMNRIDSPYWNGRKITKEECENATSEFIENLFI